MLALPRLVVPRWPLALAMFALVMAGLGLRVPLAVAVGLVMLTCLLCMPDARTADGRLADLLAWLTVAVAFLVSGAIVVVVGVALVGAPLLGSGPASIAAGILAAFLGAAVLRRGGRVALWSSASLIAWAPAVALAGTVAYRFSQPLAYWSRPVWALTDWMNHSEMVVDLVRAGTLNYDPASNSGGIASTVYPRGFHALLAWLASAVMPTATPLETWTSAITVVSASIAALAVVAVAAGGLVAFAVASRLTTSRWVLVGAPLLTALLMLHPYVYQSLALAGFLTTTASVVLLFAVVLVVDVGPTGGGFTGRTIGLAVLAVGAFYLWQPLVVPVAAVAGYLALLWWRSERDRPWSVMLALVAAAALCIPLALATLRIRDIDAARLAGILPSMPVLAVVGLVVVSIAVLTWKRLGVRPTGIAISVAAGILLVMGLALFLAQGGGLDEVPYYAGKVLWHAGVLALPAAVASFAFLLAVVLRSRRVRGVAGGRPLLRGVVIAVPVVLVIAYVGGGLSAGLTSNLTTLTAPGGPSPQVPLLVLEDAQVTGSSGRPVLPYLLHPQGWQLWLRYEDWHAAQLARSLGADVPPAAGLIGHSARVICAWLVDHPEAIRLTGPRRGQDELVQRGCPIEVVRPQDWTVVTSPGEWWQDTRWEDTGGAPDPRITPPGSLVG